MTTKEFLEMYDNKSLYLTEEEMKHLLWNDFFDEGYCEEVDRIKEDKRRWTRTVRVIFQIEDRYFEVPFEEGLTEMQDNEYYPEDITEVERKTKIIEQVYWEVKV